MGPTLVAIASRAHASMPTASITSRLPQIIITRRRLTVQPPLPITIPQPPTIPATPRLLRPATELAGLGLRPTTESIVLVVHPATESIGPLRIPAAVTTALPLLLAIAETGLVALLAVAHLVAVDLQAAVQADADSTTAYRSDSLSRMEKLALPSVRQFQAKVKWGSLMFHKRLRHNEQKMD